jgi:hypothetical protein
MLILERYRSNEGLSPFLKEADNRRLVLVSMARKSLPPEGDFKASERTDIWVVTKREIPLTGITYLDERRYVVHYLVLLSRA